MSAYSAMFASNRPGMTCLCIWSVLFLFHHRMDVFCFLDKIQYHILCFRLILLHFFCSSASPVAILSHMDPLLFQIPDLPHITSYPTSSALAHLLLVLSRIRPPVLVPEPLAGVPWVSSSDRCSRVCSLACSSGCAASLRHGPEPLRGVDRHRGRKQIDKNSFRVTIQT